MTTADTDTLASELMDDVGGMLTRNWSIATVEQCDQGENWIKPRLAALIAERADECTFAPLERDEAWLTEAKGISKLAQNGLNAINQRRIVLNQEQRQRNRRADDIASFEALKDTLRAELNKAEWTALWQRVKARHPEIKI